MPTCRSWKTGDVCWKWRPYKARQLLSKSIYAKNGGNGPLSADQDLSIAEPRHGHAVCTLRFLSRSPDTAMLFAPSGCTHPPPPAPPFLLAQSLSLKDIAGCDIMKLKVSWHLKASLAGKRLKLPLSQLVFQFNLRSDVSLPPVLTGTMAVLLTRG